VQNYAKLLKEMDADDLPSDLDPDELQDATGSDIVGVHLFQKFGIVLHTSRNMISGAVRQYTDGKEGGRVLPARD
jgi:hypothetical protein